MGVVGRIDVEQLVIAIGYAALSVSWSPHDAHAQPLVAALPAADGAIDGLKAAYRARFLFRLLSVRCR
jgi:hypothetical protein